MSFYVTVSSVYNVDPKPLKRLNFCTIIKTYAGTLPDADSEIALNYLFCLRYQFVLYK